MSINQLPSLEALTAIEILQQIAYAKTGNPEAFNEISVNTVNDAKEALEWFLEALQDQV